MSEKLQPGEGWKLVPVEPTNDMCIAAIEKWQKGVYSTFEGPGPMLYAAMLSAAPAPVIPSAGGEVVEEIAKERERQKTVEGWTLEHDDGNKNGEMATAAAWYALNAQSHDYVDMRGVGNGSSLDNHFENEYSWCKWPWDWSWWKPKDRRRDLIRSAALIVAEIERLDRATLAALQEQKP